MQDTNIKIKIGIVALVAIAIITIGAYILKKSNEEDYTYYEEMYIQNEEIAEGEDNMEVTGTLTIHITGEVNYPGVVILKEGDRVVDAIEAAGGEKDEANLNALNLAYILNDGEKIYIPNKNEETQNQEYITSGIGDNTSSNTSSALININSATIEELTSLPGIGEATANKIITYRKENGKFTSIEDLKNVPGIGNSKFEELKDLITIK